MAEPTAIEIKEQGIYRSLGLTDDEYQRVADKLGRLPNYAEAGLFGVLWSEHCSYKSSKKYLKRFPTEGPQVLQGPGENAGVVDLGDGIGIAFKMESHNHPSAVEPYQGAATGVGGILRDVFTMGARPIAFADSLRFGPLTDARTRYLFANVVSGIGGYGNCVGIPTVAGETVFDDSYTQNPLVNAMCVGVLPADKIVRGAATGVGNPVFVVGAKTGRDGIHGATFASAEDPNEKERSAVQVGDPFLGKLLMEACLELMATSRVVGIQDMGAAGLTSSSAEMASRAGGGIELNLDLVPVREAGMTPYEMMLSESQERMLVVMERGHEQVAIDILRKWGLDVAEIGRVTDDGMLRLHFRGEVVAEVPVTALVDEAPEYDRPVADVYTLAGTSSQPDHALNDEAPALHSKSGSAEAPVLSGSLADTLLDLLRDPSITDKRWVHRQYDTTVRANTVQGPGADAAIIGVPGTKRLVALTADGNGRYVFLDPRAGGAIAVAEAARNIVCSGGKPLAITNCLNFGSPEKPQIMYQFQEATAGMSDACRALDTPVVSGNVSFYNESAGVDILPTPVVGMVGVVESIDRVIPNAFQAAGNTVLLLGAMDERLDGSRLWQRLAGRPAGMAPAFDLMAERRLLDLMQALGHERRIVAAHDVSEGGLAVSLAEMCVDGGGGKGLGLSAALPDATQPLVQAGLLFSEAQGRIIVEVTPANAEALQSAAAAADVPVWVLGRTSGSRLTISSEETDTWLDVSVADLRDAYRNTLTAAMEGPVSQHAQ